jgi:hypothetical protein
MYLSCDFRTDWVFHPMYTAQTVGQAEAAYHTIYVHARSALPLSNQHCFIIHSRRFQFICRPPSKYTLYRTLRHNVLYYHHPPL